MEACIHDGFVWFCDLSDKVEKEYLFYGDVHIRQLGEKNEIIGDEVVIKTIEGKAEAKSNTNKPVIMIFDIKDKEDKGTDK